MPDKRHREHGEGSVFVRKLARKDGSIRVRYGFSITTPEGRRIQRLFETKAERDRELLAVRAGQKAIAAGNIRLDAFLTGWLQKVAKPRVGDSTYKRYAAYVEQHLSPGLGHVRLDRLSPAMVQSFLAGKLEQGAAPRTVHHMRAVLRNALNSAIKWNLISRNAAELADPPRITKAEHHRLTEAEVRKLLAALRGRRYEALYVLTLVSGLRQGEILGTCWSDLDLERGLLYVRHQLQPAGDKEYVLKELKRDTLEAQRAMALPAPVVQLLVDWQKRQQDEYVEEEWAKVGLVFTTIHGRPVYNSVANHTFQKLLDHAGLPRMRFHDLRGSCATFLATLGVHPRVAQEYLGHASMSTTMVHYTEVLPEQRREASELLAGLLWSGAGNDPATAQDSSA